MSSSRPTQHTQAPAQQPRRRTHRPASITELKQKALAVELDLTQEFKRCLKETEMWRNKGREYLERGDLERAFMLFARSATMALDTLPLHPQYMTSLKEHQRQNLSWHGQEILDQMGEIKPVLVHRFSEWRTAHPNEPLTPLDRLDHEDLEEADRNWSQRERAKAEEAAQLRRQQEDTQRHADEFRLLQRTSSSRHQLDRRKDNASNPARQSANTARSNQPEADYSFSRPQDANGAHGSQSTIVVLPEPSVKRDRDEKRRIEQEGIKRRQQEAEVQAQQIRQVIAANNSLPHGPQHQFQPDSHSLSTHSSASSFATNTSSQTSLFQQSQLSSVATTPASSFHHTQSQPSQPPPSTFQSPAAAPPPATPVRTTTQADLYYPQTPNTQPRKGSVEADVSVLFPGLSPVDVNRTPTRATLRGFAPPSTTTSPPPPRNSATSYPSLMSPHQQKQGYHPSDDSMFFADMNRLSINDGPYPSISNVFSGSSNMAAWAPEANKSAAAAAAAQFSQKMMDGGAKLRKRSGSTKYNTPAPLPAGAQPPVSAPSQPPQKYMPMPRPPLSAIAASGRIPILGPKSSSAGTNNKYAPERKLKTTVLPRETLPRFLAIAKLNTSLNRETCGLLLGKELKPGEGSPPSSRHRSSSKSEYVVTTLLIPKQHGTSDMCTMDGEELVLSFTEERSLITLGWIHTHPSQSCFMSSVDLHTHSGFQKMLPESIAVVCAPQSNPNFGIFRLTDPPGLPVILNCKEKDAFHPHPDLPIYTDADKGHVQMRDGPLEIIDLR